MANGDSVLLVGVERIETEVQLRSRFPAAYHFICAALVVIVLRALRAMNKIEVQRCGLGWSHRYLPAHRVTMIKPLKLIPSIFPQQHSGGFVGERGGGFPSGMRKRPTEAEDESAAKFVVVAVIPADD